MEKKKSETLSQITNHGKLGRAIRIGKNSHVSFNAPGHKREYFTPTVDVLIGIGKDHTATLIMDEESWKAFKEGKEINIESLKSFKSKFL